MFASPLELGVSRASDRYSPTFEQVYRLRNEQNVVARAQCTRTCAGVMRERVGNSGHTLTSRYADVKCFRGFLRASEAAVTVAVAEAANGGEPTVTPRNVIRKYARVAATGPHVADAAARRPLPVA